MAVRREKYINFLLKQKDKDIVKIITGIRRSGKSTLLFELYYDELITIGVAEDQKGYKKINMIDFLLDEKSLEKM